MKKEEKEDTIKECKGYATKEKGEKEKKGLHTIKK